MTVDKAALKGMGGPSDPTVPYSKDDLARLRTWAKSQSTVGRQTSAAALLALGIGIGAGLAGREILAVRVGDIGVSDDGVLVAVPGDRPREVGVLRTWEAALIDRSRSGDADKYAFREACDRATTAHSQLGSCESSADRLQCARSPGVKSENEIPIADLRVFQRAGKSAETAPNGDNGCRAVRTTRTGQVSLFRDRGDASRSAVWLVGDSYRRPPPRGVPLSRRYERGRRAWDPISNPMELIRGCHGEVT